ncbi:MAG: methyltransferase domain-containing protein [Planctomycetes bacterium]|nr:methyltransferase domain-containing protein [Planctomycetota bacterium]
MRTLHLLSRLTLTPFAMILLLSDPRAFAADATRILPGHPRIFLRGGDIAALRGRCRSAPRVKEAYERIRAFAYGSAMQSNLWVAPDELCSVLVAYVVEDRDPKLLARARGYIDAFSRAEGDSWTRPRMLKALAQAYDWLHADLSAAERKACAARIRTLVESMRKVYRHSDYNNHVYLEYGPIVYAGLALAGDGVDDALARSCLAQAEPLLKEHFIPAWNQVAGGDRGGWHESMSYFSFFAYEFAHQLEAWRTATGEDLFAACAGLRGAASWFLYSTRSHDGSMAPIADIETPSRWGWQEAALFSLLAARYRDAVAQAAAARVAPGVASRLWPTVLWFDPSLAPAVEATLPAATLFPGIGWAAMRSSWEKEATWAIFVCGDYYAGHQHSDQNQFIIARGGDLAIDAGEYGAKATGFHNTVLIGGGQRLYATDPVRFVSPIAEGSEFDTGDVIAFEENPLFTYVVGDASNAYGRFRDGKRVEEAPVFIRRFIFIKPGTFVVDDAVRSAAGSEAPRWLLHALEAPVIDGRVCRITQGDGELLCETVLPRDASITASADKGGRRDRAFHRIDVVAGKDAEEVRFLHVLHARGKGGADPDSPSIWIDRDGGGRLTVRADGRTIELTLPPANIPGGDIAIAEAGGKPLLERRVLAAGVLPYGPEGLRLLERWDAPYRRGGRPGWDTGKPSTVLRKAIEEGAIAPGRAVELGCGTGTNAVFLATKGFDVTAIEIAPNALRWVQAKADAAGVKVRPILADVLAVPRLEPFDLIFDRGCYHGVRRMGAAAYVESLRRLSHPGTKVLIVAGNANEERGGGPPRVREEEIRADFGALFDFVWLRETRFDTRGADASGALAWSILLERKGG